MNRRTSGFLIVPPEKQFTISAVVPLFNGEKFISEALESLLSQTHPIYEIIIIDDKSTDQGLKKVKKLAESNDRIKLLINSTNRGSSHCRNLGIKESSGHYIMFLDQDDYLNSHFIDEANKHLHKHQNKEITGFHTSYFIVDKNGNNPTESSYKEIDPEEFLGYQFVRNRILSNSGAVIKKSILEQAGFYDESLKFSQDWDLWLKLGKIGIFSYIKKPLTYIRRHSSNTSRKIDGFLSDEMRILQKYDLKYIQTCINKRNLPKKHNSLDFASILLRLNKWDIFEHEINLLTAQYPKFNDIYFYQGLMALNSSQINKALKFFSMVTKNNRFYYSAQNNLASCYILKKEFSTAANIISKILTLIPNYQDAHENQLLAESKSLEFKRIKISTRPLRENMYDYN